MAFTASQQGRYCVPDQIIDGVVVVPYKWFSLHNNKLDGTFHPLSSGTSYQVGWWGTSLSDSGGNISSAPNISLTFTTRSINSIQVVGDNQLSEYPVDFVYKLYDSSNTLLYTKTVTGNTLVTFVEYLPVTYTVARIDLTVTKINKASSVVKIVETFDAYTVKRSDTLTPNVTDTVISIGSKLTAYDTITPKADDLNKSISSTGVTTDVITPKTDELDNGITSRQTVMDILTPKTDDLLSAKTFGSIDTITPKADDLDNGITSNSIAIDTIMPNISDAINSTNSSQLVTDSLTPRFDDLDNGIASSQSTVDILLPKADDLDVGINSSQISTDTITPKADDLDNGITSSSISIDTILPNTSELIISTASSQIVADTLTPKADDLDNGISSNQSTVDALTPKVDDLDASINSSQRSTDTLTPNITDLVTYKLFGTIDIVLVNMSESRSITNTFTSQETILVNPLVDETIIFSSTDMDTYCNGDQLYDGILNPANKWFSLSNSILDSSFNPIDSTGQLEIGWWSNSLSDDYGIFTDPVTCSLTFTDNIINKIIVVGDSAVNNYPVDFTVKLYDRYNSLIYTHTVTNNAELYYTADINPVYDVVKLELSILKINQPNTQSKILELYPIPKYCIIKSMLVTFDDLYPTVLDDSMLASMQTVSDILTPMLNDIDNGISARQLVLDTLTPKLDDLDNGINSSKATTDILTPKLDDLDNGLTSNQVSIDTIAPMLGDIINNTASSQLISDSLTPRADDVSTPASSSQTVTDVLLPRLDCSVSTNVSTSTTDTLTPKLDDLDNGITSNQTSVDTILPNVTDVVISMKVNAPANDSLTPITSEVVNSITLPINVTDTLTPKVADVMSNTNVATASTDSILPNVTDLDISISSNQQVTDTITPMIVDSINSTNASAYTSDILTPSVIDTTMPTSVSGTTTDILKPKTDEFIPYKTFGTVEDIKVKFVETLYITNNFSSFDSLQALLNDATGYIGTKFYSADTADVTVFETGGEVHVSFTSTMGLQIVLDEDKVMNNVHTQADSDERRTYGKVEITYTDPFIDSTITVTSTGAAYGTTVDGAADTQRDIPYRGFALHDNVLDGSYYPLNSDSPGALGWWSNVLSDSTGSFSTPPRISVAFHERGINSLNVSGDNLNNVYVTDGTIEAYDKNGVLKYTKVISGNTSTDLNYDLSESPWLLVARMDLIINKINRPNYTARIAEFYTIVVETYTHEDRLVLIDLLEESEIDDISIPVGNISANELTVRLDNSDHHLSPENMKSPLRNLLRPNRRVKAWLGTEILKGQVEWHPLGIFWTTSWSSPRNRLDTTVVARDLINVLDQTPFDNNLLYINKSITQLFDIVLQSFGLTTLDYKIDSTLDNIIIPYTWFDKGSYREALRRLAEISLSKVFVDREGILVVTTQQATSDYFYTFDEDKNVFDIDRPQNFQKVVNYVKVNWKTYSVSAPQEVSNMPDMNISFAPQQTQDISIDFTDAPLVNITNIALISSNGSIVVDSYEAYTNNAILTIRNANSTPAMLTSIVITGTVLQPSSISTVIAKDQFAIDESGQLSYEFNSDFVQSQEMADSIAQSILTSYASDMPMIKMETRGNMGLRLGNKVIAPGYDGALDAVVVRQHYQYDGSLSSDVDVVII